MVRSSMLTQHYGVPSASPRHAKDPSLVALGAAIKRARMQTGMSQEDLAHESGLDTSYMSSIERGLQNPGLMLVLRIAAALGITGSVLLELAGL
jgi:transcriptional regulator with XRE-family HTH domain